MYLLCVLLSWSCCLRPGAALAVAAPPAACTPVNGSALSPAQLLAQAQPLPAQLASSVNASAPSSGAAAVSRLLCIAPGAPVRVVGSGPFAQGAKVSGMLRVQGTASGVPGMQDPDTAATLDVSAYASTSSAAFTATAGMLHAVWVR